MRTPADLPRRLPRTSRRFRIGVLVAVVVVVILATSLRGIARFYTDYLWFAEVHFTSVFRGVLLTKVFLGAAFTVIFFLMVLASLTVADRFAPSLIGADPLDELVVRYRAVTVGHRPLIRVVTALAFGIAGGVGANGQWNNWDLFRYSQPFGIKDPEYHRDIGFYVFRLPFIQFLVGWCFAAVVVVLIVTIVSYYLSGGIRLHGPGQRLTPAVKTHLSVLLGILALIQAVNYYYQRLALVLSNAHLVRGATATTVHADKPAKTLLIAIAVIAAGLFLYNIRQKGWLLPVVAVALWGLVYILVGTVYPALYQALRVNPSELTQERPYIQRNIDATLAAYGLQDVRRHNFVGNAPVQASQVQGSSPSQVANQQTLANVQLLDPSVNLTNTFDKYQALRTYYQFNVLSMDRYELPASAVGGQGSQPQMTATISSVRELNNQVPSGFVNSHLEYTHGYGAVVAPVSQAGVNPDGTPNFSLSDLPPSGTPALSEKGSQIYYGLGSQTSGFVIADSKTPELDYENSTGQQITTRYAGSGGVRAGGFLRRAAFALRFGDANFILSGQINNSSRVMYYRNVTQRIAKAAPFLALDSNPYSVVLGGQVWWVQDAYTISNNYPYAQTANTTGVTNSGLDTTFNYVRNSVKVVVNAYTGKMYFFVVDPSDPIIKVYEHAFPDLFTPGSKADQLIPGITAHWRYPEDLFQVQTNMYGRYHLTSASAFYTQAQAWTVSQDPGSGPLSQSSVGAFIQTPGAGLQQSTPAPLPPEYLLAHLPNHTQQSFMLLEPFVPVSPSNKQQNLTAFMTASSDPNDYGQLNLYSTPPGVTVDGPDLITNAIRSNPQISTELTLLNQQGSTVELGQVVVVPIDQTLLYVQPVFVESSANQIPTLKDVVVVYNGTAYHSENASLDAALCKVTNPDGSRPFASYCNTQFANNPNTVAGIGSSGLGSGASGSGSGSGAGSATTTTTPTVTPPATGGAATVSSLLAQANADLAAANAALRNGDLSTYQQDVDKAQAAISQAQQLQGTAPGGSGSSGSSSASPTSTSTSTTVPAARGG